MKKYAKIVHEHMGSLFASQDSKYFLATAFKMTLVPVIAFALAAYSIWNLMELNFNFFVANGFHTGEGFKEVFYQTIFGEISQYSFFFIVTIGAIFLSGFLVSYLALRPFWHMEKHMSKMMNGDSFDLPVQGLNKNKLVYRVGRIFFKYLDLVRENGQAPKIRLPKDLENLSKPKLDRVFLLQYSFVVTAVCLVSSLILVSFTSEFYDQIVENSSKLLSADHIVTTFISEEVKLLEKIRALTIFGIIVGYVAISRNIIKSVDGVSYGFSRDMLRIVNGEHDVKLRPRYADPGKSLAVTVNDFLDELFPYVNDVQELNYKSMQEEFEEELPENVIKNDFRFNPNSQPVEEDYSDLPPAFIQENEDPAGNKVFKITTPTGKKFENLSEDMAIKVVMELENQRKAS